MLQYTTVAVYLIQFRKFFCVKSFGMPVYKASGTFYRKRHFIQFSAFFKREKQYLFAPHKLCMKNVGQVQIVVHMRDRSGTTCK
ncbi:hypothetical protein FQZ97_743350 [compost metagenome]